MNEHLSGTQILSKIVFIIFLMLLLLGLVGDLLATYAESGILLRANVAFKGFSILLLIIVLTIRSSYSVVYLLFIPVGIYCIGNLINNGSLSTLDIETILVFFKIFTFFSVFYAYRIMTISQQNSIKKIAMICCFSYLFFQYFGVIFSIEKLQTYESGRSGYKGIVLAQNEASGFFIVIFFLIFLFLEADKLRAFFVNAAHLSLLILGTKAGVIAFLLIFFFRLAMRFSPVKMLIASGVFGVILISLFVYLYNTIATISALVDTSYKYYRWRVDQGIDFLTLILSGRNHKLETVFSDVINNYPLSLIITGYPLSKYYVEMDLFDTLFLGGVVYFLLLWVSYFLICKYTIQGLSVRKKRSVQFLIILLLFISVLAGHVVYSVVTTTYLAILLRSFDKEVTLVK